MIRIIDKANCCGCTACMSICAHRAISMRPDDLGFLYPVVDESKCVDCGLCEKVCAFNDHYDTSSNLEKPLVFGARHKNLGYVETSRSGAAFIALSDWILGNGGVVYGAGYTEHFKVTHKRASTFDERDEFKGSKYVQSDLGQCFRQIKQDLRSGIKVLFSGTPCQTAGLKSYVGKHLSAELYLVDIVCHGVPSPYIWKDYLKHLEDNRNAIVTNVCFRDKKSFGWASHHESYCFDDGTSLSSSSYTFLFYKHIMFRQSCGNCYFCNIHRPSDVTIGDFWGWQKTDPDFNKDDKGVSLLFCNTKKGESLFEAIKTSLFYFPARIEDVLQPNLQHPTVIHPRRQQFEKDYANKGFSFVFYKYGDKGWRNKLSVLINHLKRMIKRMI